MRKKLVYICSPCRGDIEKNIEKALMYILPSFLTTPSRRNALRAWT